MRVHFVAVAGTGMGALAGLFRAAGHDVSGSDTAFDPPMGPALEAWGIRLLKGFDAAHLEPAPDLVVVGNVCRPTNVEARAAIDRGLRVTSMAHALADHVLDRCRPLVVGGTHGKTTTSAMVATLLDRAGLDPGFLIGGLPKNFPTSFRLPGSMAPGAAEASGGAQRKLPILGEPSAQARPPFVVEGDEYDTAFFEKTPKFWHYKPEVAIVTSIEHDHVDIYPDEASYLAAFRGFVERVPPNGLVVASGADRRVVELVRSSARCSSTFFGLEGDDFGDVSPEWVGAPAGSEERGQAFDLFAGGTLVGRLGLRVPGLHNIRNAVAAIAAACQGYDVPLRTAGRALAEFQGVRRRQDLLFVARGVHVYEDFAHHPTAVHETLAALKQRHPRGRLWAVFEARSATACRAMHQREYAGAFGAADRVVFAPLGRQDIAEGERLDLGRLAAELAGKGASVAASVDAIVDTLASEAEPNDVIALLSNGAFGGIYEKLRRRFVEALTDAPGVL